MCTRIVYVHLGGTGFFQVPIALGSKGILFHIPTCVLAYVHLVGMGFFMIPLVFTRYCDMYCNNR